MGRDARGRGLGVFLAVVDVIFVLPMCKRIGVEQIVIEHLRPSCEALMVALMKEPLKTKHVVGSIHWLASEVEMAEACEVLIE